MGITAMHFRSFHQGYVKGLRNGNSGGGLFFSIDIVEGLQQKLFRRTFADAVLASAALSKNKKIAASCRFSVFDAALNSFHCNPSTYIQKK